jgi:amino acid transporter
MTLQNDVHVLTTTGLAWASLLMLSFCIINIVSFKGLIRFNFALFFFKIGVIIIAIFALMHASFITENFNGMHAGLFSADGWHGILTAVATGGVAFAFTGFKHGVELAGEAKQMAFAIPLAIIGSVLACLALYIGLQVAFLGAVQPQDLTAGWANLSFPGDAGPFAGLAAGLGLVWLVKLLYVDAAISPAGAGLIYVTSTARILYAMSEIGYVPRWLTYLNQQKFPVAAIAVNFVLGMFLFLPLPGWEAMVSFLVSGMVISYAIGPIALLSLRYELPNKQREFRVPAAHVFCVLAFYFCNLLSYWTGWDTIYKISIAMGIGIIFFIFAVVRGSVQWNDIGIKSALWIVPYFAGLMLISYYGAFGGQNIISFGWDFLVIGIFSVAILTLAVKNRAAFAGDKVFDGRLAAISTI